MQQSCAIYGGTFCPIHWGHIRIAQAVEKHMQFDEFLFLPCKSPVLDKEVHVSPEDRVEMLKIALKSYPKFTLSLIEVLRETPSYMVDTLIDFRKNRGQLISMTLIMGMDSFLQLPRWHHWEQLLELAHLFVVERAGVSMVMPKLLQQLLDKHQTHDKQELLVNPYGRIYRYQAGLFPISSSAIRTLLHEGQSTRGLLPEKVRDYIDRYQLF
jgi:nicotinate-nucleotide adenylyltransferase